MMTATDRSDVSDFPEYLQAREYLHKGQGLLTLEGAGKFHVPILAQVGGDKRAAAEILGISRATIYRLPSEKEYA